MAAAHIDLFRQLTFEQNRKGAQTIPTCETDESFSSRIFESLVRNVNKNS
jgi:hypothetical protein